MPATALRAALEDDSSQMSTASGGGVSGGDGARDSVSSSSVSASHRLSSPPSPSSSEDEEALASAFLSKSYATQSYEISSAAIIPDHYARPSVGAIGSTGAVPNIIGRKESSGQKEDRKEKKGERERERERERVVCECVLLSHTCLTRHFTHLCLRFGLFASARPSRAASAV